MTMECLFNKMTENKAARPLVNCMIRDKIL